MSIYSAVSNCYTMVLSYERQVTLTREVLVLGGARPGIGQAVTTRFISEGARVYATYEYDDRDELGTYVDQMAGVEWIATSSSDSRSALTELAGLPQTIGAVVNSEFYFYMESADKFDLDEWNRSLFSNLTLPKAIGHNAINVWRDCKSVVFITSSEAATGSFGAHAYAATKAAVHNLTKSLANVAAGKCRFNSLAAGWIGGVMDTDEVFNMSRRVTPLGRLGNPEEVAAAAAWLTSDESSFVNGATIVADGGYTGVDTISKFEFESEFGTLQTSD